MKKISNLIQNNPLIWFALLSLPGIWALLVPGLYGASDEVHVAWLYEMYETLKTGQFPPRYVPDLSFGFGYPLFNFVFPLPFYISTIFYSLGLSLVGSVKMLFLVSLVLSGYFMYRFLRDYADDFLSILGGLVYMYTPYRSTDMYIRGAIGEVLSFVFFPLALFCIHRLTKKEEKSKLRWLGYGALSIGALVLTHNIASYMFLPFLIGFGFVRIMRSVDKTRDLKRLLTLFLLGLGFSAYFWIPAISESNLVKYSTTFDFWDHYPTFRQLFTPYFGYGASVPGPYDGLSFFLGYPNIFIIVITLFVFIKSYKELSTDDRDLLLWSLFVLVVSFALMNHRSLSLWKVVPFLPYFQFPWRFLMMTTLTTSVAIISLKYIKWGIVKWFVVFLVFLSFSNFRPQDFLGRQDAYFLEKYIPYPKVDSKYLTQGEEYLRLPAESQIRPDRVYPRFFGQGNYTIDIFEKNRLASGAYIESTEGVVLSYNKYYFPGWKVKVDGHETQVFAGEPFGQVTFNVPSGKHKVDVYFEETDSRKVINLLSLFSLAIIWGIVTRKNAKNI